MSLPLHSVRRADVPIDAITRFVNARLVTPHGIVKGEVWCCNGVFISPEETFWRVGEERRREGRRGEDRGGEERRGEEGRGEEKTGEERRGEERAVSTAKHKIGAADITIDVGGNFLCPGFIDCQINGAYGVDFSSPELSIDDVMGVLLRLPSTGVTSICPTLVSSSTATYKHALHTFAEFTEWRRAQGQAAVPCTRNVGLHLEGPLMALERRGAHASHNITAAHAALQSAIEASQSAGKCGEEVEKAALEAVYGPVEWASGLVRLVTLAPELPHSLSLISFLQRVGIVVSIGHTAADIKQADDAVQAGARMITHLFNAMSGFHHRDPGVPGLIGRRPNWSKQHKQRTSLTTIPPVTHQKSNTTLPEEGLGDTPATDEPVSPPVEISAVMQPFSLASIAGGQRRIYATNNHTTSASRASHSSTSDTNASSEGGMSGSGGAGVGLRRALGTSLEVAVGSPACITSHPYTNTSSKDTDINASDMKDGSEGNVKSGTVNTDAVERATAPRVEEDSKATAHTNTASNAPYHASSTSYTSILTTGKTSGRHSARSAPMITAGTSLPFAVQPEWPSPIDRPYFGLIVDGVHNHPYAVNVAFTSHFQGLVLVTDAIKAMGLPPGNHTLGELSVEIYHGAEDGHYEGLHAVLAGSTTLAGAVVPLDKCVQNLRAYTACTVPEAIATVTTHPARVLGLQRVIGTLTPGAWADFVILNDDLEVQQTYVSGQLAFAKHDGWDT